MAHPFQDKLFVFIGTPRRCKRRAARDVLVDVGGIPDEKITAFTNFVVAFDRSESTQAYQKALEYNGIFLSILTEEQFFDILEGKAMSPEMPKRDNSVIVIPAQDPEAEARESERVMADILNRKRMNNLRNHGVTTPDGRVKVDLRQLDTLVGVMRIINERETENEKNQT